MEWPLPQRFRTRVRLPPPPPLQRIRIGFRVLRRSHVEKCQGLQVRHGPVIGPPRLRRHRFEANPAQQGAEEQSRTLRTALENVLEDRNRLPDPGERLRPSNGLTAPTEQLQLCFEFVPPTLRSEQSFRKRGSLTPLR